MFYLIHCDTHECVNFGAIVGIANDKRGLMELLFNYHKYHFNVMKPNITFEESDLDIQIFKITEEHYNFLLKEINNKMDKIDENFEKNNFKPECSCSNFLFSILVNDLPDYSIFDKKFHKKYYDIIQKSDELII